MPITVPLLRKFDMVLYRAQALALADVGAMAIEVVGASGAGLDAVCIDRAAP